MMDDSSSNAVASPGFAVLGAGTWGITLADVLARNGHRVRCWDIDAKLIESMRATRRHPKLEGFERCDAVELTSDLAHALADCGAVVLVVPSQAMRQACEAARATGRTGGVGTWVICSKGIEQGTLMLMHEVVADVLGADAAARTGVLSGPSHAEEVSRGLPTTLVACAAGARQAEAIQQWFFRPRLRVYTHDDPRGVELGAAIKNVVAIAVGISDGMGFGDNTRAALMTRGLAEIVRLGLAMGARLETFLGLSGVGDLIVTATSRHSRNHMFGEMLAEGASSEEALGRIGMVVEGYHTVRAVRGLARRHDVPMPIADAVHAMLYEGVGPRQAVEELLSRDPKPEHY
jgi:glycerol-3-phosphate dehydrogenase (NAD(P)+)